MNEQIAQRLAEVGVVLHSAMPPRHSYVPSTRAGKLLFLSGKTPRVDGTLRFTGRLGEDVDLETGVAAARSAAVNALSSLETEVGLEHVEQILKLTGFVASANGFVNQSQVVNGASDVFSHALGDKGRHARTAVGVAYLPGNAPVELDLVVHLS